MLTIGYSDGTVEPNNDKWRCEMASEEVIKAAIERIVSSYSAWTIGITEDPERRRGEHGNPSAWHQWQADTEGIARRVEKYFLDKGMKGDTGGGVSPDWVYIF